MGDPHTSYASKAHHGLPSLTPLRQPTYDFTTTTIPGQPASGSGNKQEEPGSTPAILIRASFNTSLDTPSSTEKEKDLVTNTITAGGPNDVLPFSQSEDDKPSDNPRFLLEAPEDEDDLEDFDIQIPADLDTRPSFLLKLFGAMDTDGTGVLTYEQAFAGISGHPAFSSIPRQAIEKLVRGLDLDNSNNITQHEFVLAMQEIAARYVLPMGCTIECFVYDFNPKTARHRMLTPETVSKFLQEQPFPQQEGTTRWINVIGDNASFILRLGQHYHLHPLLIEDILSNTERSKVQPCGEAEDSLLVLIPTVQLLVDAPLDGASTTDPTKERLEKSPTVVQIEREFPSYRLHIQPMSILVIRKQVIISFFKEVSPTTEGCIERILNPASKLRLGDSLFLMYTLLDLEIDRIFPIIATFKNSLERAQVRIDMQERTPEACTRMLSQIWRQFNLLVYWLRPLHGTVASLCERCQTPELSHHMADLRDHVTTLLEQCNSLQAWARALREDYTDEQQTIISSNQNKMNTVLYILTIVSTIFIPAQFLTGVYGMNFEEMPELRWKWSYLIFWVIVLLLSVGVLTLFKKMRWFSLTESPSNTRGTPAETASLLQRQRTMAKQDWGTRSSPHLGKPITVANLKRQTSGMPPILSP